MSASVRSIISNGYHGLLVDIECSLSNNLPNIVIVGFANKAVSEARERIRGAFTSSQLQLPRKRITINLAPADIPKAESGFDLAIAASILRASQQVPQPIPATHAIIGELSLEGHVRGVRGIIGKLLAGRSYGIEQFYIPTANLEQARLVPNIKLVPVSSLKEFSVLLATAGQQQLIDTGGGMDLRATSPTLNTGVNPAASQVSLSEVVGQLQAKRALEIAAAGGHNIMFNGPPGTGKSMLAKALPSILPPLSQEEVLEVTHVHSLASHDYERPVLARPFRTPHHSASHVAVTGGGQTLKPGEISLAHRGVLFMDELPEFARFTLEALRQPLEDKVISLARAKDAADFPANFILVATANPCPCGYFGTAKDCICQPYEVGRYQQRLSGPILDRIDLHSFVHDVDHEHLLTQAPDAKVDQLVKERVAKARQQQAMRYGDTVKLNADMTNRDIKLQAKLENEARQLLNTAAQRLNISARSYMRTIKVARTIADLEGSPAINVAHLSEALAYRRPEAAP
jgi:magnesium chelatase family protein